MERDLDAVVAAGERLVDRVVDGLVEEVVEAPLAGRADVHARPEPDRLETLQDGDVLGGVSGVGVRFGHEKSPANSAFAGALKYIRRSGRSRLERGLRRPPARRARAAPDRRSRPPRRRPRAPVPRSPSEAPEGAPADPPRP